jgi:hypothetical protein
MSDGERVKRPRPTRTQPIRNFATLFGPGAPGARTGFPFGGPIPGGPPPAGPGETGRAAPPAGDPISRGVDLGYRVIDAYMREGQKAAQRMWSPYTGSAAPGADVQQRLTAMFRQTADLASMWFDLSQAFGLPGVGGGQVPGSVVAGPFSSGRQPGPAPDAARAPEPGPAPGPGPAPEPDRGPERGIVEEHPATLTVELHSPQPAEVSIDLRPRSAGIPLRVHDLRDVDPDKPRLRGATVVATPDGVRIHVQVPADQPPGVYSGVILDERTSLPRGVLTVRVREPGEV